MVGFLIISFFSFSPYFLFLLLPPSILPCVFFVSILWANKQYLWYRDWYGLVVRDVYICGPVSMCRVSVWRPGEELHRPRRNARERPDRRLVERPQLVAYSRQVLNHSYAVQIGLQNRGCTTDSN